MDVLQHLLIKGAVEVVQPDCHKNNTQRAILKPLKKREKKRKILGKNKSISTVNGMLKVYKFLPNFSLAWC